MRSSKSRGEDLPARLHRQAARDSLRTVVGGLAKSIFLLIPLLWPLLWVLAPINAEAQGRAQGRAFAEGRILVKPRAGLSEERFEQILRRNRGRAIGLVRALGVRIVEVPQQAEAAVASALSRNRHIKFAELDMLMEPAETIPNDPKFTEAWHLTRIAAPSAWDVSLGDNTVVAVLDTGVDAFHLDLSTNVVSGWNSASQDNDTSDVAGHGTKVAGTLAAVSNNGLGVASVAWNALIMPIRITNRSDTYAYWSDAARGMTWAADHGARVANLSYNGASGSSTIRSAAQYFKDKGGVVVLAASNTGSDPGYAASSAHISVSATNSDDTKASFSSYGAYVDLAAPGVGIWTTSRGGGFSAPSGTSFSSPIVAGIVAMMMSANRSLSPDEIESILKYTADDIGDPGWDLFFGAGRVNAAAAVALASDAVPSDTAPPSVEITAPRAGSTVSGLVAVDVQATDDFGVSRVELYAGSQRVGTDTTHPYAFSWDTSSALPGANGLVAYAYDATGNEGRSLTVDVTVDNGTTQDGDGDSTPPQVVISSPTNGASVNGSVKLSAFATDNGAVSMVKIYVDGKLKCAGSPSVSCGWNTRKSGSGSHTVQATAEDAAGNTASTSVTVDVTGSGNSKGKGRKK